MDLSSEIPGNVSSVVAEEYAAMCMDDPVFVSKFTNWPAENARKLVAARERLYDEFKAAGIDSVEDVVGVELAKAYLAYAEGDLGMAELRMERIMAICLRAIRRLNLERSESNDEDQGILGHGPGASGPQEGPGQVCRGEDRQDAGMVRPGEPLGGVEGHA
jgi:hypothetical protein